MSREIKFRVFAKGVKKMLYFDNPGLVMCNFDEGPGYGMGLRLVGGHAYLGEYSDLMQYAGFHDYKGKEIYEGDIVTDSVIKGVVAWSDNACGFIIRIIEFDECARRIRKCNQDDWKIVGNIYDNPEMLGGALK